MNKHTVFCSIALAIVLTALIALNAYTLDLTHGCYNIFDILFM